MTGDPMNTPVMSCFYSGLAVFDFAPLARISVGKFEIDKIIPR